jgi:hypothetical protein
MTKHQRKYRVTKRFRLDFEIFVLARNEDEAVIEAESVEIGAWNEFDSSWEFMSAEQVRHLTLVEPIDEPEIVRPVIKIWERNKAKGI